MPELWRQRGRHLKWQPSGQGTPKLSALALEQSLAQAVYRLDREADGMV